MEKKLDIEVEIRKAIKAEKILFGKKQTVASLKSGKAKVAILPKSGFYNDVLIKYAKYSNIPVVNFDADPYKLGVVCGRQHAINALVILK